MFKGCLSNKMKLGIPVEELRIVACLNHERKASRSGGQANIAGGKTRRLKTPGGRTRRLKPSRGTNGVGYDTEEKGPRYQHRLAHNHSKYAEGLQA
jgi:hypothetical protein